MAWKFNRIKRNVHEIRFDLTRSKEWEQWVLLRSDVHHDNPKCNQDLEKQHLDEAMDYDAPIIDNGDLFCAMQGKWDKRSDKNALRPEHQGSNYLDLLVDTAADFYEPYKTHFAIFGLGNHETAITKSHETDLTDRLAAKLRNRGGIAQASGYGGWVLFRFIDPSKRYGVMDTVFMFHYHGTGGGGPVTRGTIQTNRLAVPHPDAQIVLTGHTHDEWQVPIRRQRISNRGEPYQDEQLHVRAPGYKDAWDDGYGGFEVEKMLGPKPIGAAWLKFWWDNKTQCVRYDTQRAK